jgi:hypothetical protein
MEQTPEYFNYLGGRKMTAMWVAMAIGTVIELYTERGLSTTMASFLAGAVGTVSVANVINTVKTFGGRATEEVDASEAEPSASKAEVDRLSQAVQNDMQTVSNTLEGFQNALIETNKRLNVVLQTRK